MDQTCTFRCARERKLAVRAGGGSFGAAEGSGEGGRCKSARGGKMAGIRLERRDDFARLGNLVSFNPQPKAQANGCSTPPLACASASLRLRVKRVMFSLEAGFMQAVNKMHTPREADCGASRAAAVGSVGLMPRGEKFSTGMHRDVGEAGASGQGVPREGNGRRGPRLPTLRGAQLRNFCCAFSKDHKSLSHNDLSQILRGGGVSKKCQNVARCAAGGLQLEGGFGRNLMSWAGSARLGTTLADWRSASADSPAARYAGTRFGPG